MDVRINGDGELLSPERSILAAYMQQCPNGAFTALAQNHFEDTN